MKNKKVYRIELLIVSFSAMLNMTILAFRICTGEFQFQDFYARWQECAYLLRGISPFDALTGSDIRPDIGPIDPDMVTVPWAWVWGQVINPGFLSYHIAKIWGIIAYILICGFTIMLIFLYLNKRHGIKWAVLGGLFLLTQYNLGWSFLCGNQGALACCFIIQAMVIYKKKPYLAGILLAFSMIKPQVALPFVLTFLILREYKIIAVLACSELISLLYIWGKLHVGLIELLHQTSDVGTNLKGVFFGLFDLLKYVGVDTGIILLLDFIVAIIVYAFITKKMWKTETSVFGVFLGSIISSTFWFYKQPHDWVILVVPCVLLLEYICSDSYIDIQLILFFQIVLVGLLYVQGLFRKVLGLLATGIDDYFSKQLFMTVTVIVVIIIGIAMSIILGKETHVRND